MADVEKRTDSQATMPKVLVGLTVAAMIVPSGSIGRNDLSSSLNRSSSSGSSALTKVAKPDVGREVMDVQ